MHNTITQTTVMNSISVSITGIALLCSLACVLPGTFLMLRGVALMSDAISHAILPGIVVMFLVVKQLNSPWLLIGASCAGLATVILTECIVQTKRLKKDTAIGLVFPLFFSIGVILISLYTRTIHLDVDMVLLGELAFAPFDRFLFFSYDLGPSALWMMGGIALCNALCIGLFYKELVLATFDQTFACVIGYHPRGIYYALMTLTSITAVGAFNVVGSIVVVALMLVPPAAAYLITQQVHTLIITSVMFAVSATLLGCSIAQYADVSLAGSIAVANGLIFFIVLILAPGTGILSTVLRRRKIVESKPICVTPYVQDKPAMQEYDTGARQLPDHQLDR
jgi:manganese/zinc/iron transport system permease protein